MKLQQSCTTREEDTGQREVHRSFSHVPTTEVLVQAITRFFSGFFNCVGLHDFCSSGVKSVTGIVQLKRNSLSTSIMGTTKSGRNTPPDIEMLAEIDDDSSSLIKLFFDLQNTQRSIDAKLMKTTKLNRDIPHDGNMLVEIIPSLKKQFDMQRTQRSSCICICYFDVKSVVDIGQLMRNSPSATLTGTRKLDKNIHSDEEIDNDLAALSKVFQSIPLTEETKGIVPPDLAKSKKQSIDLETENHFTAITEETCHFFRGTESANHWNDVS